ncbi:MAG TPA: DUF721 domain-containing protein [Bryobacteraceae bacterium]|nr:DUF721 domain-containing protein [Bryobacteraceae bacterium]
MERAGRILGKLKIKAIEVAGVKTYHLAPGAWPAAVGKTVAAHTRPVFLDGTRLIVEVEDAIWQAQLGALRPSILGQLDHVLGSGIVSSLDFRVAPPRRLPATAAAASAADEADRIQDPGMRRVYRSARRKASA